MSKNLLKALPELIDAGVITPDIAERIENHYAFKKSGGSRLMIVFSILGALLIGLGIILIIAHNWDDFSRAVKLSFALLPMLIAQLLCITTSIRKLNVSWREASSVLLMMSVAAAISIVSQVYNIPGSMKSFLLTWMMLSLPIAYAMRSKMVSLLIVAGITWYACEVSYFTYTTRDDIAWYYWLMLGLLLPFIIFVFRQPGKNFQIVHAWFIAASLTITLGMFSHDKDPWVLAAYSSLFCAFLLISKYLSDKNIPGSFAFLIAGSLGHAIMLIALSYKNAWTNFSANEISKAMIAAAVVTGVAVILLVALLRRNLARELHPLSFLFMLFIPLLYLGSTMPVLGQIGSNVLVLIIAFVTTRRGAQQDNLIILNYGLSIMAVLVLCRFFDTQLSFALRGIMFIAVGAAFFATNYYTLRKRKTAGQ